jgi:hypothetical protein
MATVDGAAFMTTESTPGTASSPPAAADAIDYHTLTLAAQTGAVERAVVRGTRWRPAEKAPWRKHFSLELETELKHLDLSSPSTPPELHELLLASGWAYDGGGAAGGVHVYTLADDPAAAAATKPVTIFKEARTARQSGPPLVVGGLAVTAHGCVGGLVIEFPEDGEAVVRWSGLGAYNKPTTQGAQATASYHVGHPATGLTLAQIHGTYAPVVRSLQLDTALAPQLRTAGNQLAWPAYLAEQGPPSGALVIELVDANEIDVHDLWAQATLATWTFETSLGTALIRLTLSGVQVGTPEMQSAQPNTLSIPFTVHTGVELRWDDGVA